MGRKILSLFTSAAFIVFTFSCYSIQPQRVKTVTDLEGKNVMVLGVVKKSGETVKFDKGRPGIIEGDKVVGIGKVEIEIKKSDIEEIMRDNSGKIRVITTRDGKKFEPVLTKVKEDTFLFTINQDAKIMIPLSDVDQIIAGQKGGLHGVGFLVVLGALGIALYFVAISGWADWNCP